MLYLTMTWPEMKFSHKFTYCGNHLETSYKVYACVNYLESSVFNNISYLKKSVSFVHVYALRKVRNHLEIQCKVSANGNNAETYRNYYKVSALRKPYVKLSHQVYTGFPYGFHFAETVLFTQWGYYQVAPEGSG